MPKSPTLRAAEREAKRQIGSNKRLDQLKRDPSFITALDSVLLGSSRPSASPIQTSLVDTSKPLDETLAKIGIRSIFDLIRIVKPVGGGGGGGFGRGSGVGGGGRPGMSRSEKAAARKRIDREKAGRDAKAKLEKAVERSGKPTENVPATIPQKGVPPKRRSTIEEIMENERQKWRNLGPAIGVIAATTAGLIKQKEQAASPPVIPPTGSPSEPLGKPWQGPPFSGPIQPPASGPIVAEKPSKAVQKEFQGPVQPPPKDPFADIKVPTTPPRPKPASQTATIPTPSRKKIDLLELAQLGVAAAALLTRKTPTPRGDPITIRQQRERQFLQPQTQPRLQPTKPKSDTCEKRRRRNRKTCWEGFYREYPTRTKFVKWTKVNCKTRKIIEEK